MYLKNLIISNNDGLIRRIDFHPGLNLIVDDTREGTEMTGNNVGKTTVLRLIDYCLGAKDTPIYTASDGSQNQIVKDFLVETEAIVELCLVSTFAEDKAHTVIVRRNFLKRAKALNQVNGKNHLPRDYQDALQMAMWGVNTSSPNFEQIISHSIRINNTKHEQPLLTMGKGKEAMYEALCLYLFGLYEDFYGAKQELRKKISKELSFKKRLEKENATLRSLKTHKNRVDEAIKRMIEKKEALNVNPDFEADLEKQVQIKRELTRLAMRQNNLELRYRLVNDAVNEMQVINVKADKDEVKAIYVQAKAFGAELHRTFSELLQFHKDMLVEKANFVRSELPELNKALDQCYKEIDDVRKEEYALEKKLKLSVSFETYEKINEELFKQIQEQGRLQAGIDQLEKVTEVIAEKEKELKKIDDSLFTPEYTKKIDDRLDEFNDFFSAVSQKMYGQDFTIGQEKVTSKDGKPCYKFRIDENGNFSEGVKKGEGTCFDLAYVSFADKMDIPVLHFLLNDKEELIHDNQLMKIAEIVEEQKNVQYVATILRDKLPEDLTAEKYIVQKLSKQDRLFKIEDSSWHKNKQHSD